jgi:hypothetical protein
VLVSNAEAAYTYPPWNKITVNDKKKIKVTSNKLRSLFTGDPFHEKTRYEVMGNG